MSVRRAIRRVWEAYRLLRVASYTAGALAGVGGLAGAYWTLLTRRMRAALSEDSPEYAADTAVDPWRAGERAAGLIRAFRDVRIMAGARLVPILCLSGLLIVLLILMNLRMPKPDNPFDRDPVRLFPDADRTWIRMAAGGRCEHRGLFGLLRCRGRSSIWTIITRGRGAGPRTGTIWSACAPATTCANPIGYRPSCARGCCTGRA